MAPCKATASASAADMGWEGEPSPAAASRWARWMLCLASRRRWRSSASLCRASCSTSCPAGMWSMLAWSAAGLWLCPNCCTDRPVCLPSHCTVEREALANSEPGPWCTVGCRRPEVLANRAAMSGWAGDREGEPNEVPVAGPCPRMPASVRLSTVWLLDSVAGGVPMGRAAAPPGRCRCTPPALADFEGASDVTAAAAWCAWKYCTARSMRSRNSSRTCGSTSYPRGGAATLCSWPTKCAVSSDAPATNAADTASAVRGVCRSCPATCAAGPMAASNCTGAHRSKDSTWRMKHRETPMTSLGRTPELGSALATCTRSCRVGTSARETSRVASASPAHREATPAKRACMSSEPWWAWDGNRFILRLVEAAEMGSAAPTTPSKDPNSNSDPSTLRARAARSCTAPSSATAAELVMPWDATSSSAGDANGAPRSTSASSLRAFGGMWLPCLAGDLRWGDRLACVCCRGGDCPGAGAAWRWSGRSWSKYRGPASWEKCG